MVVELRWNPHPVMVPIRDIKDNIRVLQSLYDCRVGGSS